MKIAVTGHKGQIGSELVKRGYEPLDCDITNLDQVNDAIHSVNPDVIIHCAAATDVGWCETHEKRAFAVNVGGTNNLLYDFTGTLIYLSTVHVFNGQKYWDYSEKHTPSPVNVYGFTKWSGEQISRFGMARSIVIRLSRTFPYDVVDTVWKMNQSNQMEFPTFIKRSFVYLPHLVDGVSWVVEHLDSVPEILNIAGTSTISYYQFWRFIAEAYGIDRELVVPRKHEIDLPPRPFRGGLNTRLAKKLGVPLYSALDGIKEMKK